MLKHWSCWAGAWLLFTLFGVPGANAHDLPLDRVMNAFVKIEPHEAHLVVRVPLDLLRGVPFPLSGDHYKIEASRAAVETTVKGLASLLQLWENNVRLVPSSATGQLAPLSDRSFEDYDRAVAQVTEPLAADTVIAFEQGYLDAHLIYPISSPRSVFTIQSTIGADLGDYVKLTIRFMPLGEPSRVMLITGASGRVALDPVWYEASGGFVKLGIEHILSGIDHLLFLLCLIIPFRRITALIPIITAFTVGHSITLIGTAYNLAPIGPWFPPFIEAAIAASIFYMAIENIIGAKLSQRWIITGLFGLVHGFGFADVLKEQLQFAGSHLLVAAVLQYRNRDRPACRSLRLRPCPRPAVARPHGRTNGNYCAVRDHRQYRLAVDDAARRGLMADPVAATHRVGFDDFAALDGRPGACRRRCQASRQVDRAQMAEAWPDGRKPG
jgi:hydrogenase/urease accessory protein HupE